MCKTNASARSGLMPPAKIPEARSGFMLQMARLLRSVAAGELK
jgi:hypothetical protein